ncbi:MAG TPA: Stk1 family PASTA domain-containing Ser/Thr kinase [Clostridia bacterium]|jgi:serine/threonine-protein kinase|nr:Stk1 family PASTA domain-containing Ser/Thr kinase [Clostridia bacterium]
MHDKLLNHRYQIIEKIGGGGMALVYKAQDTLLNRVVAIKVLHKHFCNDEEFIRRFRREAEAAASLSHSNIVNIYDIGKTEEDYFIVMEYVEGKTLSQIINEEGPLDIDRTVEIAIQICEALEEAHKKGIVHRDIKPHNIIITADDRIKVADFGIAQAATSLTMTQPNSVLGSVHYSSPEQARGGFVDARSDLYSLGVVMYEMLTKQVPFQGENHITIALKHIQEPFLPPSQINPAIPKNLERIVSRALEKDTMQRYQSAEELRKDLELFYTKGQVSKETLRHNPGLLSRNAPTQIYPTVRRKAGGEQGSKTFSKKQKNKYLLWIVGGFAALVGVGIILLFTVPNLFYVPNVEVPDLIGKTLAEAQELLAKEKLSLSIIREEYSKELPAQSILYQDPAPKETVKQGRTVQVIVSRGPKIIKVEDVTNKPLRDAKVILNGQNLEIGKISYSYHPEIPAEYVIEQNPKNGTDVLEGTEVDLKVSKGSEEVLIEVPNFLNQPLDNVLKEIENLGLKVGRIDQQVNSTVQAGRVISQSVQPGEKVAAGKIIDLTVSKGELKRTTVNFEVPNGPESQKVQVKVITADGERIVYEQNHSPGDQINRVIEWSGETARIQVIIDGVVRSDNVVQ